MLTAAKRITASLRCGFVLLLFLAVVISLTSLVMAQPGGAFTPTGSMTTARMSHTATLLADGRVLISGGQIFSDGRWSGTRSAELYDPSTGTFTATGDMTTMRLSQAATLLPDGKVLMAGGLDGESNPLATAELYDPQTGTFIATGDMTMARCSKGAIARIVRTDCKLVATPLQDGRVLIAGGLDGENHPLATAELYDPQTGTFIATGEMTMARRAPTATLLLDGRVLIADGYGSGELYDPQTGIFTATGHMTTGRLYQTATLLLDGKVLIAGGLDGESDPLWTAELYDPHTGTFTATGDMTTALMLVFINCGGPGCLLQQGRVFHTSTLLPDGTVLLAGGWANYGPGHEDLASAELYDPLAGTFSATGDMATGRSLHTATLLNDGSVLIAGGIENYLAFSGIPGVPDPLPKVLESTELYHPAALALPH